MEPIVRIKEPLDLFIGPYILHVFQQSTEYKEYSFPGSAGMYTIRQTRYEQEYPLDLMIQLEEFQRNADALLVESYEEGPLPYQIYRTNRGDYLWVRQNYYKEESLVFRISKDFKEWRLIKDNSGSCGFDSFTELSYIFPYSVLNKQGIMFHGVIMEWQGIGIIVCAHSGVGKTTHTRMWKESENAVIINGDRALCYKDKEIWYTCGAPWHGSSGENQNRRVKLAAIVVLEQSKTNHIVGLPPLQGAMELIQLAFAPVWDQTLFEASLDHINDMVQKVPVYKLRCTPDLEAVQVLKEKLL